MQSPSQLGQTTWNCRAASMLSSRPTNFGSMIGTEMHFRANKHARMVQIKIFMPTFPHTHENSPNVPAGEDVDIASPTNHMTFARSCRAPSKLLLFPKRITINRNRCFTFIAQTKHWFDFPVFHGIHETIAFTQISQHNLPSFLSSILIFFHPTSHIH